MNKASRIAPRLDLQANPFQLRASLFHSTPPSERRRRNHWDYAGSFRGPSKKFNQYQRRLKKQNLLHNVSEFADHLFQRWQQSDRDDFDQPAGRGSSWFRPEFRDDGYKRGKSRNRTSRLFRRGFEFCDDDIDDDVEFETIFRGAFGGSRSFSWSFTTDDEPRYRSSSSYSSNYKTSSSGWKYQCYEEYEDYDSSSKHYSSKQERARDDTSSDRLALGLSPSGPLNIEEVKNAYRTCALKWHPDRHQGTSKVVAEEKFKVCSAAYQSLCDKMALH